MKKAANEALKVNVNNVLAYNEIGLVYLQQEDYDKAFFIFQQATSKQGGAANPTVRANFGKTLYLQGKKDLAKPHLVEALSYDESLIDAAMLLAFIHLDNRAWDAANKVLSKAIVYEPNNASLYNALGFRHEVWRNR